MRLKYNRSRISHYPPIIALIGTNIPSISLVLLLSSCNQFLSRVFWFENKETSTLVLPFRMHCSWRWSCHYQVWHYPSFPSPSYRSNNNNNNIFMIVLFQPNVFYLFSTIEANPIQRYTSKRWRESMPLLPIKYWYLRMLSMESNRQKQQVIIV